MKEFLGGAFRALIRDDTESAKPPVKQSLENLAMYITTAALAKTEDIKQDIRDLLPR